MLTYEELIGLDRTTRERKVLSVYLSGEVTDPAERTAWRRSLDRSLFATRASLARAPREERVEFDRCVELLQERLAPIEGAIGAVGYAAFVAADGVRYAQTLPVPVPSLVAWGMGLRLAPYVRALKQLRPAIVAVVSTEHAIIYHYVRGELTKLETIRAVTHQGPPLHMGDAPRHGFHSPTRGATGSDEAERQARVALHRLVGALSRRMVELAGPDGWLVVGGTPDPASAAAGEMPDSVLSRVLLQPSLHADATEAQVARAAEESARTLRRAEDRRLVDEVIERSGAAGLGVLGVEPTLRALRERSTDEVFFTRRFVARYPDEAEEVVRTALAQGTVLEEVSGTAAERLDSDFEGIAARLRFLPYRGVQPALAPEELHS